MIFKLKEASVKYLLFCLILFGNYWIWRALSLNFLLFLLLVTSSVLTLRFIKAKGSLLAFLFFVVVLIFSQWKTTTPTSLTILSNDDIRLKDQRLKEYPPVFIKVGKKAIWIPAGHWFEQRQEAIAASRLTTNLSEVLDPNLYFFANHPRERVGVIEFDKFPYIIFPFFLVGIFKTVELKRSNIFYTIFILTIFLLSLFGNKNPLGPFMLFPFIVNLSAIGAEDFVRKLRGAFLATK